MGVTLALGPICTPATSSIRGLRQSYPRGTKLAKRDPLSIAQAHLDAVNARDLNKLAACYADDAILEFPASPRVEGRAAIRRAFQAFFEHWNERSDYWTIVAAGDTVAVEGTSTGTHRTLHLRIPGRVAVGGARPYRHDFAMFLTVKEGKIQRHRVYFDARDLVHQLLQ